MLLKEDLNQISNLLKENNETLKKEMDVRFKANNEILTKEMDIRFKANNEILIAEMKENTEELARIINTTVVPDLESLKEKVDQLPTKYEMNHYIDTKFFRLKDDLFAIDKRVEKLENKMK